MEVKVAVLADCANIAGGSKMNIMGIFSELRAPSFPLVHPFMVLAFRLELSYEDGGREHELVVKAIDEDGRELLAAAQRFTLATIAPGEFQYIDQVMSLPGVAIERPGALAFRLSWDGAERARVPLRIRQVGE